MSEELILVVDDSHQNADYIANSILPSLGYTGVTAYGGKAGLRLLRENHQKISLMLLDLQMPELSGLELLRAAINEGINVPAIMITAHSSEQVIADAFRLGVHDYLKKPVDVDQLNLTITRAVSERRLQREKAKLTVQLQAQVSWLTALSAVGRSVTSTLNIDMVLRRILEAGVSLTHAEQGFIALREANTDMLYLRAVKDTNDQKIDTVRIPVNDTLIQHALKTGQPVRRTRPSVGERLKVSTGLLVTSLIHVPIFYQGKPLGVLSVNNHTQMRNFTQRDETLLASLADYAAIAIGNASSFEKAKQEIEERKRAEEALQELDERFQHVAENAQEWIWEVDASGLYTYASPVVEKVLGYKPEEVVGKKHFYDLFHPEDRDELKDAALEAFAQKQSFSDFQNRNVSKGGKTVWLSTSGVPILDKERRLLGFRGADTDITERKRAEEALSVSEEQFRSTFEQAAVGISQTTPDGRFIKVNQRYCDIVGYSREELLTLNFKEITHPNDLDADKEYVQQVLVGEIHTFSIEKRFIRKDSSLVWVNLTFSVVWKQPDIPKYFIGVIEDITERKRVEKAQDVIYRISQTVVYTETLNDLYRSIHDILGELMPVENFYIALYDSTNQVVSFPYYADKFDQQPSPRKSGLGITEYIMRTGRPLLASAEILTKLIKHGEVELIGEIPVDFLGVPLKIDDRIIGVIVTQSYTEGIRFSQDVMNLLEFVSTQVAMTIERKQSEVAIKRHLEQEMALREIDKAISSTLDINEVLSVILHELERVIEYTSTSIFLFSDGKAKLSAGLGFPDMERALQVTFPIEDDPLILKLIQEERPLVIPDAQANKLFRARGGAKYVRSWIGVPLTTKGKAVGVLTIDHWEPDVYDEDSANTVMSFANQAAIAIENARLFSEAERRLEYLRALRKIDQAIASSFDIQFTYNIFLEQVINQLGVDAANVLHLESHLNTLQFATGRGFRTSFLQHTNLKLGEGHAGLAVLERRIIHVPDLNQVDTGLLRSPHLRAEKFISYFAVPLIAKGEVKGVLEIFHRSSLEPDPEWFDFLNTLAGQAAITIDNVTLFNDLQRVNIELIRAYDSTIEGWARALELRDMETEGHSRRVVDLTLRLAHMIGCSSEELVHIRRGALLHDIGKMGVPDSILQRPGPLTDEDWQIMREHPVYAYEWLSSIDFLRTAMDIPYCHHEKWDGTGYPRGLKGEQIPLAARIFAIVDVWDALRSDRPYRKAWSEQKVLEHIKEQSGIHFDPQVVEVFLELLNSSGQELSTNT